MNKHSGHAPSHPDNIVHKVKPEDDITLNPDELRRQLIEESRNLLNKCSDGEHYTPTYIVKMMTNLMLDFGQKMVVQSSNEEDVAPLLNLATEILAANPTLSRTHYARMMGKAKSEKKTAAAHTATIQSVTPQAKEKRSLAQKARWQRDKGVNRSEETKEKMRVAQQARRAREQEREEKET